MVMDRVTSSVILIPTKWAERNTGMGVSSIPPLDEASRTGGSRSGLSVQEKSQISENNITNSRTF
jgi:hypothetical protein